MTIQVRETGQAAPWTIVLLIAIALVGSGPLAAAVSPEKAEALRAAVAAKGDVPLLIKYDKAAATVPKSDLSAAGPEGLGKRLDDLNAKSVKSFRHAPFIAATLDAPAVDAVLSDPDVVDVAIDELNAPMLDESIMLIGGIAAGTFGFDGLGQSVAILDTGFDIDHPFLAGRIVHEACFSSNTADATSLCPNGQVEEIGPGASIHCSDHFSCRHGTHVTGIAAGGEPSGDSGGPALRGVAPSAGIIAIQVFSRFDNPTICNGSAFCLRAYNSDIIRALEHVYSLRDDFEIAAINMSFGGGSYTAACDSDSRRYIIDLLRSAGIASVASAGNDASAVSIGAPACIPSVIAVGATSKTDAVASFSNSSDLLDLLAPGLAIYSSVPDDTFATLSGTSMAAPHVTGALAVLRSGAPDASVEELLDALRFSGVPVTDLRNGLVKPRIQLDDALAYLENMAQGNLAVQQAGDAVITRVVGSPFDPSPLTYTLTNVGSAPILYRVVEDATWLDAGPRRGSLAAGASVDVTLRLNESVTGLAVGDRVATVGFRNLTNGIGDSTRTIRLAVLPPPPFNDDLADAAVLTGALVSAAGDNVQATAEPGEPAHAGAGGGQSVWWQWTAPFAGGVEIDTLGSDFDTVLAVYTGERVAELTEIVSNDDSDGLQSRVLFRTTAGQRYLIAVDGFADNTGDIALNLRAVEPDDLPNDEFADATKVRFADLPVLANNRWATAEPGEPLHAGVGGGQTLWWRWRAYRDGLATFSTAGSDFDTVVAVYTGSRVDALQEIASNDDLGSAQGEVSFHAELGTYYYVAVDGYAGATGNVVLTGNITRPPEVPLNDDLVDATRLRLADVPVFADSRLATSEPGEPAHAGYGGGMSLWWRWRAYRDGVATFTTDGSEFDTVLAVYTGDRVDDLREVASNDDDGSSQSRVSFVAESGTFYYIAVDGYGPASGDIVLSGSLRRADAYRYR